MTTLLASHRKSQRSDQEVRQSEKGAQRGKHLTHLASAGKAGVANHREGTFPEGGINPYRGQFDMG